MAAVTGFSRFLLLATVLLLAQVTAFDQAQDPIGQTGGYPHLKTHAYWSDLSPTARTTDPPYVPPASRVYNTGGGPVDGKINVHIVPHTHDDTGWQITVDQYYFQNVYYVIDTVVKELMEDENRKFMYVEVGFFARWWDQVPDKKREAARALVKNGQLEFINGGWCMHDEASPYYVEMADQTTRGHQWLAKNFGEDAIPRGTWSIDPFGHSSTQAWLLGAESGMNSMFWGRTDYQDFNKRKNQSRLEWIWQGSQSLGAGAEIFAGALYGGGGGGYGTWIGYDGSDKQVQDDPRRHDYNIDQLVDQMVQDARTQAANTRTDHQLWACGSDFQYQNAAHWYRNLDKIIHYLNQNGTVNAFYSTPTRYVEAKKKADLTWERRYDDVMPLADDAHHYWSGYFTSRPALKRQVRFSSNYLNAARQMEVVSGVTAAMVKTPTTRPSPVVGDSWTDSLEGTIGIATHHDGMSGTERQDVANDYSLRMSESMREVEQGIGMSLQKLMGATGPGELYHCNCNGDGAEDCLNVTVCARTANSSHLTVVAWSPIARPTTQLLRVPVSGAAWRVIDQSSGKPMQAQVVPLDNRTLSIPLMYINKYKLTKAQLQAERARRANKATHVLVFSAQLPPAGYATFSAVRADRATLRDKARRAQLATQARPVSMRPSAGGPFTVDNGVYSLTFNPTSGLLETVTNLRSKVSTPLSVSWGWYNSSVGGGGDKQKSGAYMFRPNSSTFFYPGPAQTPTLKVAKGPVVTEVFQVFSEWATQVYRLVQGAPYVEVEWTAGPIPMDTPWLPADSVGSTRYDKWGKELVVRYSSGLKSGRDFYADSNGRELIKRTTDGRGPSYPPLKVNEPIAGNYYPVTAMMAVRDAAADVELVVLTDTTQGGSSLHEGELEYMVHRRLQVDDSRGVQEPLNETMCGCNDIGAAPGQMGAHGAEGDGGCECVGLTMRGVHWLVLDRTEAAHATRRTLQEQLNFGATLAFADGPVSTLAPTFSALKAAMPANVRLMTLTNNYQAWNDGQVLIRLAHMYSVGEHPTLSQDAAVSLAEVFGSAGLKVASAKAMSLTGNQAIEDMDNAKLDWKTVDVTGGKVDAQIAENGPSQTQRHAFDPSDPTLTVTLRPMEVRTFFCTLDTGAATK